MNSAIDEPATGRSRREKTTGREETVKSHLWNEKGRSFEAEQRGRGRKQKVMVER